MPATPRYVPTPEHLEIVRAIVLAGGTNDDARSAIGVGKVTFEARVAPLFRDLRRQLETERRARKAEKKAARAELLEARRLQREADRAEKDLILQAIKNAPRPRREHPAYPLPEDVALAEQLVAEGLTQRQIAARMGIHHGAPRFRALKPTFDRLRPERISSKVELTPEQMALGIEMVRNGARRPEIAKALGRRYGSTAIDRLFRTEINAVREEKRVPCFICGEINPEKNPESETCSDKCDHERKLILGREYVEEHREEIREKYHAHPLKPLRMERNRAERKAQYAELKAIEAAFAELGICEPPHPLGRYKTRNYDRQKARAYYQRNRARILATAKAKRAGEGASPNVTWVRRRALKQVYEEVILNKGGENAAI